MTHDELMVKINQRYWKMFNHNSLDQTESGIEHRTFIQNQYFALRAVVELHPMVEQGELFIDGDRYGVTVYMCGKCNVPYPCEDVKAIEKELQ